MKLLKLKRTWLTAGVLFTFGLNVSAQAQDSSLPAFVKVEGGTFIMGDANGDLDEGPLHQVTVSTFYMSPTEVTVGQFREFCNATKGKLPGQYAHEPHDDEPIRFVNFNVAQKYCQWLSQQTGKTIQLPTEAQWEFAARGGVKSEGHRYAKGALESIETSNDGMLHHVGTREPNELGLYDMSENVWEWCRTKRGDYPTKAQVNPTGPEKGPRVVRGGSYINGKMPYSRVTDRNSYLDHYPVHDLGFRVIYETGEAPPVGSKPIPTFTDTMLDRQLPYEGVQHFVDTREARTKWFKDAKLGMFIHWGMYSAAGGYYKGQRYKQHYAEWIQNHAKTDTKDYAEQLAHLFTAEDYDASAWADLAKKMGARYAVLTTKHHEGFTLFNSTHPYAQKNGNPYGVEINISPEGRDLVAEYAQAFREKDIKVGFYYSLIDWQHPDCPFHYDLNTPERTNDTKAYQAYLQSHISQLMSDYGQIDVLWSDYSTVAKQSETWSTRELLEIAAEKQPQIVLNNRFWNGVENPYGDIVTPEKYVPATGFGENAWEVCHTMNESFGFSAHDKKWKSPEKLFQLLVDINSKGGNFLLNIGPDAKGNVPQEAVAILERFGAMVHKYESEIFGTKASLFSKLPFNGKSNTVLTDNGDSRLNFFIYNSTTGKKKKKKKVSAISSIAINGIQNEISKVYLSASKQEVPFEHQNGTLHINLPKDQTDSFGWVVSVDLKGKPEIKTAK